MSNPSFFLLESDEESSCWKEICFLGLGKWIHWMFLRPALLVSVKYLRFSLLVFVSTVGLVTGAFAQAAKSNLLFFLSNVLTNHDIGCYGNKEILTPNIDQLAEGGLRFEYCFNSVPMCAPTRMSYCTGRHPVRNGVHPNHSRVHDRTFNY